MFKNMIIKREIGGQPVEIALSYDEIEKAREEFEVEIMRENIQDFQDEDIPPEVLDELAEMAWNYVKYNDMSFSEACQAAVDSLLDNEMFA